MDEKITGSFEKGNTENEVIFEILEQYGSLNNLGGKWRKELNLVSWNGAIAKFDLRRWNSDHDQMGRGITLTLDEIRELKRILNAMDLD